MGTTKKAIYKIDNGTDYDIIHYETEDTQVKTQNGTSTLDVDLGNKVNTSDVANNGLGRAYGYIPKVQTDGSIDIGKYLDFHDTSADGLDYKNRITSNGVDILQLNGSSMLTAKNTGLNTTLLVCNDASSGNGIVTGQYYTPSNATNIPIIQAGTLYVGQISGTYITQIWISSNTGVIYSRCMSNGTWTSWDYLIKRTGFTEILDSIGYTKLPNGLIIQWGQVTGITTAGATITFPLSFPTGLCSVTATAYSSGGNTAITSYVTGLNQTNFYVKNSATADVRWIAIGY